MLNRKKELKRIKFLPKYLVVSKISSTFASSIRKDKRSLTKKKDIDVIQLVEFCIWDAVVVGSSPVIYTKY